MAMLGADTTIVCPVLIGRTQYVAPYERVLRSLEEGRGGTIAISGEAGIGKSRLARELTARSTRALPALAVLQGHSFERDATLPFAPILDLLRSFVAPLDPEEIAEQLGPEACEVVKLLPELQVRLPGSSPSPLLDPEQEKRRLFHALVQLFERIAADRAALILIEDLHWSDDTSLEFLAHLARRSAQSRMVLLLTYRADEVSASLAHFLAGLDRERTVAEWPLDRFTLDDVSAMIAAIFALSGQPRRDLVQPLYELTDGNPYFVEEVLKSLTASGAITVNDGAWERTSVAALSIPRSVQDAVRQRSSGTTDAARRLLTYAAVSGRRFDLPLLQRVSGTSEEEMLPLLKELVAAQIIVEESGERFAFRHALTQQAIYSALLTTERRLLHREVAVALESVAALNDAHLVEMAHHFYEAGMWDRAFEYSIQVGDRALKLYSPAAAVQHFTRALDAATNAGIAAPAWVYSARGNAYQLLGDFHPARADHERALAMTRDAADAPGEWRALIDLGFLWAARDYDRSGDFFRRALDLARAGDDRLLLGQSLNRLGNWLVNTGRSAEGIEQHRAALKIFEDVGDRAGMGATLDLLGMANGIHGDLPAAVAHLSEAIPILKECGDEARLMSALTSRTVYAGANNADVVPAALRSIEDVRQDGQAAIALAEQTGSSVGASYAYWSLGSGLASFGLLGEGLQLAQTGLRIAREIGHEQWIVGSHFTLGQIYLWMLDPESALNELEQAWPIARALKSAWWIGNVGSHLALASLQCGDPARARTVLADANPNDEPARTLAARRVAWARAELFLAAGAPDNALALVDDLIASQPGDGRRAIPPLLLTRARALIGKGAAAAACAALEEAHEAASAAGAAPWLCQIELELGRAHDVAGRRDEAEAAFAEARATVERLSASIDDDAARERFDRAAERILPRRRAMTPRQAETLASEGLTRREREVTAQVMQGRSNREIADALVLSERTVETHIANIFSKLGFTSRAQLAAWAADRSRSEGT